MPRPKRQCHAEENKEQIVGARKARRRILFGAAETGRSDCPWDLQIPVRFSSLIGRSFRESQKSENGYGLGVQPGPGGTESKT